MSILEDLRENFNVYYKLDQVPNESAFSCNYEDNKRVFVCMDKYKYIETMQDQMMGGHTNYNFHEIIKTCNLFADLDSKTEINIDQFVKDCIAHIKTIYSTTLTNVFISSATFPSIDGKVEKYSYHVIFELLKYDWANKKILRLGFKNQTKQRYFWQSFKKQYKYNYIDFEVYKKNHTLRAIYSSKLGEDRPLMPYGDGKYKKLVFGTKIETQKQEDFLHRTTTRTYERQVVNEVECEFNPAKYFCNAKIDMFLKQKTVIKYEKATFCEYQRERIIAGLKIYLEKYLETNTKERELTLSGNFQERDPNTRKNWSYIVSHLYSFFEGNQLGLFLALTFFESIGWNRKADILETRNIYSGEIYKYSVEGFLEFLGVDSIEYDEIYCEPRIKPLGQKFEKLTTDIVYEDNCLAREEYRKIIGIKSGCKTGKSTTILREYKDLSILCITYRITLAEDIIAKNKENGTEFIKYGSENQDECPKHFLVQVESLHKYINWIQNFDLVIIDEALHFVQQLSHKPSHNLGVAVKKIMRSRNIIFMSANFNNHCLNFIRTYVGNEKIHLIKNTYQHYKHHVIKRVSAEFCETNILKQLEQGKKIFLATNSLNKVRNLIMRAEKKGSRVCFMNSQTKEQNVEILKDIDKNVINYDLFIISPTIEAGVSINIKYFDYLYGWFVRGSNNAYGQYQALFRARNLNFTTAYLSMPSGRDNKDYFSYQDCKSYVAAEKFFAGSKFDNLTFCDKSLKNVKIDLRDEFNRVQCYNQMFQSYCEKNNYAILTDELREAGYSFEGKADGESIKPDFEEINQHEIEKMSEDSFNMEFLKRRGISTKVKLNELANKYKSLKIAVETILTYERSIEVQQDFAAGTSKNVPDKKALVIGHFLYNFMGKVFTPEQLDEYLKSHESLILNAFKRKTKFNPKKGSRYNATISKYANGFLKAAGISIEKPQRTSHYLINMPTMPHLQTGEII